MKSWWERRKTVQIKYPEAKKVRIEIVPMIDVMFLILVFFIYGMLSMAVHKGVFVKLPTSTQAESRKLKEISVTLDKNGALYVNKVEIRLEDLSNYLTANFQDKDFVILLFADKDVNYQSIFNVLDKVKHAGFHKISLQAKKE